MENLELACFQLISSVGMAKSAFIEAVQEAKKGNFDQANAKIEEGDQAFVQGHGAHAGLIQQEAAGNSVTVTMLLMHAEDQLMSAETIKVMALELIENYKRIQTIEEKLK